MDEIDDGASGTAVRAARELRVVFSRLLRRLREAAESTDLTPSQTSVLSRLDKEGAASTSDLAAVERVRPQSMASTLAPLDQRGLIRRDPDPQDGRRLAREEWLARAFQDGYTEAELRTIVEALGLLDRMNRS